MFLFAHCCLFKVAGVLSVALATTLKLFLFENADFAELIDADATKAVHVSTPATMALQPLPTEKGALDVAADSDADAHTVQATMEMVRKMTEKADDAAATPAQLLADEPAPALIPMTAQKEV